MNDARRSILSGTSYAPSGRHDRVHQAASASRTRTRGRSTAVPRHGRDHRERRQEIPGEAVAEDRQAPVHEREDVDDGDQLALRRSRGRARRPRTSRCFSATLLRKKLTSASTVNAAKRPRSHAWAPQRSHASPGSFSFSSSNCQPPGRAGCGSGCAAAGCARRRGPCGPTTSGEEGDQNQRRGRGASAAIIWRAPAARAAAVRHGVRCFRTARDALVTLIVALETASMSAPTLNASRMFLPRNCGGKAQDGPPRSCRMARGARSR